MKILLTGATGFIGRHLLSFWKGQHEIFALVRDLKLKHSDDGVRYVHADLTQPLDVQRLPTEVEAIVHLAQANVAFPGGAEELFAVNTAAVQHLLDYGRRVGARRFLLASTGDVYGQRVGPSKESDPVKPTSFYGATKAAAEMLAAAYADYLPACSLRLYRPYGPGQTNRLMPHLAEQIRQGKPVQLNREGRPHANPIYIDDVMIALDRCLHHPFCGAMNVAGDTAVSIRDLACRIGRVLGVDPTFVDTDREAGDSLGDNDQMKAILGRWPLVDLQEGLTRTFAREGGSGCRG
jgi:nucleoside-diphosphate-sugar epimerase